MTLSPLLTAHNISLILQNRQILNHIDLTLEPGKLITLIGPNGAGKTSLLKILMGLLKPTSGHIHKSSTLRIGYMPQKVTLDESLPLTVMGFLKLFHPQLNNEEINKTLLSVSASSLKNRSLHKLSGGEFQRVLLTRALLGNPNLLILDEPTQGIDVLGQEELYHCVDYQRKSSHCAVLMVSHDLHQVLSSSDHVVCLNGHICCQGNPVHVQENPDYLALFQGFKSNKNLAPYVHHHDHKHDH